MRDFYIDMLKNQSLSLVGDINSKVQIMGLLESRGVDFDNVIICSVNEGVLPKDNFNSTFLPFDVRKNLTYLQLKMLMQEQHMIFTD